MFFPVFLTAKQYCQIFQRNDLQQGNKIRNTLLQKLEALLRGTHGKRKNFGTKILSAIIIDIISLCSWQFCSERQRRGAQVSWEAHAYLQTPPSLSSFVPLPGKPPPPPPPPVPMRMVQHNKRREWDH